MTRYRNESEIAAAYNEWAQTYDCVENATRDLAAEVLRQADLKLSGRTIIEVGCGTGRNTEWLASPRSDVSQIVGLDFSAQMLARARERVRDSRVRFIQHDVSEVWPLADAAADVVMAMLVLEHLESLPRFFAEAARVLSPGGTLFICELHPMRQMLGGRAQFTSKQTGERQLIPAFLHDTSDYVNDALSSGFELIHLGEWRDAGALPTDPPRLVSLQARLRSSLEMDDGSAR
ncbi:MAG TPA: methyltransferase domain-containing protein [Pyrinomonadaceae bacterium]|nr:methyltransferase domain-containing protein [Pyrinomonadaceae bacterium]